MNLTQFAAAATALILLATAGAPASADEPDINVQHFEASPHGGDMLMIRTAARTRSGPSGGLLLSYAKDPFSIEDNREGYSGTFEIVDQHLVGDLFLAWGAWDRFSLGVNLPLVLFTAGETGTVQAPPADAWGLGDVRIGLRYLVVPREANGFGLGFDLDGSIPTATEGTYAGTGSMAGTPRIVLDYMFSSTLFALNLGYRFQKAGELAGFEKDGGMLAGLGIRHGLVEDKIQLLAEFSFLTSHGDPFSQNGSALEAQVGINGCVGDWARVFVAGGSGFLSGVGEAGFRITSGLRIERCRPKPPKPKPVEPKPVEPKPVEPKPVEPETPKELLEIAQRIQFETGSAKLLAQSETDLDRVALWLQEHPSVTGVLVEGHSDDLGDPQKNLDLSAARAQAVVKYLISKNVPAQRLEAQGLGSQRPIGDNSTEKGRKANRRVEFKVLGTESHNE